MIISPIFYMGAKRKLINKGLCELFPENIKTFVDVFSGSGIVSMNTKSEKYIVNDIDTHLQELYRLFSNSNLDEIISQIDFLIDTYELPRERTKRNQFHDKSKIELYRNSYFKMREDYNKSHNVMMLYTLTFFSFSQQFRFNNKGDFNMPFGNDCFSEKNKEYIKNGCNFFSSDNIDITSCDFRQLFNLYHKNEDCFFYCDPPYLNTTAVYNERGSGWTDTDLNTLLGYLCLINECGRKFALSSVLENKGKENIILSKWIEDTGFKVHEFQNFNYSACGKGNAKTREVLITNY